MATAADPLVLLQAVRWLRARTFPRP